MAEGDEAAVAAVEGAQAAQAEGHTAAKSGVEYCPLGQADAETLAAWRALPLHQNATAGSSSAV